MKALILISLLLPALAWAQGPLLWDKTLGGSGWDEPHSVVATPDGGCIIAGQSDSGKEGDKSESGHGSTDMWVVRLDAQGKKVWDKSIGGGDVDVARGIISTEDGNYLLIGYSKSNKGGDKSENCRGDFDVWVVKIDTSGNKIWDKTFGGQDTDAAYAGIVSNDKGLLIVGQSASNKGSDKSEDNKGEGDYWIIRLDDVGDKLWDKTIGGNGYDWCYSVTTSADGGFFIAGHSQSDKSGDKSEDRKHEYDGWVIKIDNNGNKMWDRTIGRGNLFYSDASIVVTPDNGCLFTASGGYEPIKLDADGNEQWRFNYGPTACYSLINISDGRFLLAGESQSNKGQYKSEDSHGFEDFWLIKLNAQGQLIRDKTLGGTGPESCHAMIETADGGLVMVGRSDTQTKGGDKTDDGRGQVDYWVVKLGPDPPPLQWRNMITLPANIGKSDGVVRMTAYGGKEPYEYSLDNGQNYGGSRIFNDLPAGIYKAAVRDASGTVIHVDVLLRER